MYCFATQTAGAFLLPIIYCKMRNNTTTPQTTPRELPMNLQAFINAPSVQVDPINEIQSMYQVDQYTACDIYETVGDQYTNEKLVAALCSIASPAYLELLKGGLSC